MPIARRMVRALVAVAAYAAVALGCGAPSAALLTRDETPPTEALHYFSPHAPLVVTIATGQLDRVPGAARLWRLGDRHRILQSQLEGLLDGQLVIGIPVRGAAPLAAIVTSDGGTLETLARSRAGARLATPAGMYRGAALYRGEDHAFAVRGRTLLISRTTADLRDALERRQARRVLGEPHLDERTPALAGDQVARGYVEFGAVLPYGRWREFPFTAALQGAGATVVAGEDGLTARVRIDTDEGKLLELDVPVGSGARPPRGVTTPAPALVVANLARLLRTLERALEAGAPVVALRIRQARAALPYRRGSDLVEELLERLAGPATLIRSGTDLYLRADPTRRVDHLMAPLAERLPRALSRIGRFATRRRHGLHELRRGRRTLLRFGIVRHRLVAGTGAPRSLKLLGRLPLRRVQGARGPVTFSGPAGVIWDALSGWRVAGWLRGTPDATVADITLKPR